MSTVRDAITIIDSERCVGITVRPGNGVVLLEIEFWELEGGQRTTRTVEVDTLHVGNLASALRKFARVANGGESNG